MVVVDDLEDLQEYQDSTNYMSKLKRMVGRRTQWIVATKTLKMKPFDNFQQIKL